MNAGDANRWEIRSCGGTPYLVEGGLAYPAGIDATERPTVPLGGAWLLLLDPGDEGESAGWQSMRGWDRAERVTLPGTLNPAGSPLVDYLGAAWFARSISRGDLAGLAAQSDERWGASGRVRVRLALEGFLIRATAWLDGRRVFAREGGYTDGWADLGSADELLAASAGRDLPLVIRVDNRHHADSLPMRLGPYHTPGWHTYLGIHRDLRLEAVPEREIFKIDARPIAGGFLLTALVAGSREELPDVLEARLAEADSRAADATPAPDANGALRAIPVAPMAVTVPRAAVVRDGPPAARFVASYAATLAVPGLRPWSPEDPTLYRLELSIPGGDAAVCITGWRTIKVVNRRLKLNGEPVFLRGICKHEDHPQYGATNPPSLAASDLDLVRELGANYVRTAHYPHARHELSRARARGLLVFEEIPYYQAGNGFVHWYADKRPWREFPLALFGARHLRRRALRRNAGRQLAEMVERDRNNPAVIGWGLANEAFTLTRRSICAYAHMRTIAKALDPTRPTTLAEFTYGKQILDRRRRGAHAVDILSLNAYYGWYYGSIDELEARLDELAARFPDTPILLSEFGAGAVRGRSESAGEFRGPRIPPGRTFGEEFQSRLVAHYACVARRHPAVVGISPWVFADFLCTEFPTNPIPNTNLKGLLAAYREPKLAWRTLTDVYHAWREEEIDPASPRVGRDESARLRGSE